MPPITSAVDDFDTVRGEVHIAGRLEVDNNEFAVAEAGESMEGGSPLDL
jgi:hypothetical protein